MGRPGGAEMTVALMFLGLVGLILLNVPIAISLGIVDHEQLPVAEALK